MKQPGVRPVLVALALAVVLLAGYWETFSRYFVSEDFFTLRFLAHHPFWETLWSHLTGPMMGIDLVAFYRPVSLAIMHIAYLALGTDSFAYLAAGFAMHGFNTLLVYLVAKNIMRDELAGHAIALNIAFGVCFTYAPGTGQLRFSPLRLNILHSIRVWMVSVHIFTFWEKHHAPVP